MVPEAAEDLEDIASFYTAQGEGLSSKFETEVKHAVERIAFHPRAWTLLSGRTRRCLLHDFPYGIVYQILGETIRVVAVVHNQRRPGSWRNRVRHD
jgi:plasmid stabilization system protein ParE